MAIEHDHEIRELAYKIWQEEGCPHGHHVDHWLRAQMIWEEINRTQCKPKQSKARKGRKATQTHAAEQEL
jgi:hypothetical protein